MDDPTVTDPDTYRVVFENHRVRVLEYRDRPGARTRPHDHPDSVMATLARARRGAVGGRGGGAAARRGAGLRRGRVAPVTTPDRNAGGGGP